MAESGHVSGEKWFIEERPNTPLTFALPGTH
jgi:hypothetical protein